MKMWIVLIRDQTTRSVQSDLNLHCPQNLLVSPSVRKDKTVTKKNKNNEYKSYHGRIVIIRLS